MLPPVGLKAIALTSTSIMVTWSDNMLSRSQPNTDNRYYTVKYRAQGSRKVKYVDSTNLAVPIGNLRPNTEYQFSVKITEGRQHSIWSLSVLTKTFEAGE